MEVVTDEDIDTGTGILTFQVNTLFYHPFLWKPNKIISFLKDAHNCIKGHHTPKKKDTNQGDEDTEISDFKGRLDSSWRELSAESFDWQAILGEVHFKILTTRSKKNVTTSVVDLLGVIRNKYEHSNEFENHEREELGWFPDVSKRDADDCLIVNYWTEKFPNLVPFLWMNFQEFSSNLREYYGCPVGNGVPINVMDFIRHVLALLQYNLEQGGLVGRFMAFSINKSLEFRVLNLELLQQTLSGCTALKLQILSNSVTITWLQNDNVVNSMKYSFKDNSTLDLTVVMVIGYSAEAENMIIQGLSCSDRVVYLTDRSIAKDAEASLIRRILDSINLKFSKNPVKWADIGESSRKILETNSKLKIGAGDKEISFYDILPKNNEEKQFLLSHLQGQSLNMLLKSNKLEILRNHELPSKSEIYFERKLFDRSVVNSKLFHQKFQNDFFVVTNISYEMFHRKVNDCKILLSSEDELSLLELVDDKQTVLLIENEIKRYEKVVLIVFEKVKMRNVHCFRYLKDDKFQWKLSFGVFSNVEELITSLAREVGLTNEERFVQDHIASMEERIVFIADKPGMGKSQILTSVAEKIHQNVPNRIVVFIYLSEFCEHLLPFWVNRSNLTLKEVANALVEVICKDNFERKLLEYWLLIRNPEMIMFEILFDGLDEVAQESRKIAFLTLQFIQTKMHSVRAWVTVRDHMLENIRSNFGCLGYKLEPFSENVQIDFLERHWSKYWERIQIGPRPSSEDLRNFAKRCIEIPLSSNESDIAGVPLQCRMIAEINERKILSGDLTIEENINHSLLNLYEKMIERKLEIYLKEKKRICIQSLQTNTTALEVSMDEYFIHTLRQNIELAHTYFAIKLILDDDLADAFKDRLLLKGSKVGYLKLKSTLLEIGIIEKMEPLVFIHRTFAEFLVAQFVFKIFTGQLVQIPDSDYLALKLLHDIMSATFGKTTKNHLALLTSREKHYSCQYKHPTIMHFLNVILNERKVKMFPLEFTDLLQKTLSNCCTMYYGGWEVIEKAPLFAAAEKLGYKNISILLVKSPEQFLGLFVTALKLNQFEFCKYVIENFEDFNPSKWDRVQTFNSKHKYGMLHWVCKGRGIYKHLNTEKEFINFIKYIVEKDNTTLEQRDDKGRTPLLIFMKRTVVVDLQYAFGFLTFIVQKLGADVNAKDNDGNTVLHFPKMFCSRGGSLFGSEYLVSVYFRAYGFLKHAGCTEETVNYVNAVGQTPLLRALQVFGENLMLREENNMRGLQIVYLIGANFNAKDGDGNTALHISIEKDYSLEFIQELVEYGADIFLLNKNGQNALHLAVEMEREDLVNYFVLNGALFSLCDKDIFGNTVLEYETSEEVEDYLKLIVNAKPSLITDLIVARGDNYKLNLFKIPGYAMYYLLKLL